MMKILTREYRELNWNMGEAKDICRAVAEDYSGATYISDAIMEKADSFCPIYTHDIWENVHNIREYIEEAIEEGLVDTKEANLEQIFLAGYYKYYESCCYENLSTIKFNYLADYLNNGDEKLKEKLTGLSDCDIESIIEEISEDYNHDTYNDLEEALIDKLTEYIEE